MSHAIDIFYKYTDANSAKKILAAGTLKWSSPLLFNDPFDVPRELAFGFGKEDISKAIKKLICDLVLQPPDDISGYAGDLQKTLALIKKGINEELIKEIKEFLISSDFVEGQQYIELGFEKLRSEWAQRLNTLRILCLCECPRRISMWYHYAKSYSGAVIGLSCLRELDSPLLLARKIQYKQDKTIHYTPDGIASLFVKEHYSAATALIDIGLYTKSEDWSYEKEWRVVTYADEPGDHYSFYSLPPGSFSCIYFGPNILQNDRTDLLELVSKHQNLKAFDMKIGQDRELHFTPCNG